MKHLSSLFYRVKNSFLLLSPLLLFSSCTAKRGEGTTYLTYLLLMFAPLLLSIFIVIFRNEKARIKRLKNDEKLSLKRFKTPLVIIGMFLFSLLFANFLPLELEKNDEDAFLQDIHAQDHVSAIQNYKKAYLAKPEKNRKLLDLAYTLSKNDHLPEWKGLPIDLEDEEELKETIEGQQIRIGCIWLMSKNDYYLYQVVEKVSEEEYGALFFKGLHELDNKRYKGAIDYFEQSIDANGFKRGAVYELSVLYYRYDKNIELDGLIDHPELNEFVPLEIRREVYYNRGELNEYVDVIVELHLRNINIYGFLGALLVLGSWLVFFRIINPFFKESIGWTVFVLLFSMVITFGAHFLYDFLNYTIGFTIRDHVFLYTVFGIGLVEELVKVIPFTLVLLFSKDFKEPYNYIYYACISALGFSFIENFAVYFDEESISIVQGRGLIACFGHMFDLSILGYIMMLARFKYKIPAPLAFIIGLGLAMFSHGLYDYILIVEMPIFLFMIFFFVLVKIWAVMTNNTLNLSTNFDWNKLHGYENIKFYFVIVLISIILGEYLLLTIQMGAEVANDALAGNVFRGVVLIVFMGVSLTNYDFFPTYIERLSIPYRLSDLLFPRIVNTNNFIGYSVKLLKSKYYKNKILLPVSGEIVSRHVVGNNVDWYLLKLEEAIDVRDKYHKDYLLICFNEHDASIKDYKKCDVSCAVLSIDQNLEKIKVTAKMLSSKFDCIAKEVSF